MRPLFAVRAAQLQAFDEALDPGGLSALVTRAREAWPQQAARLGDAGLRAHVEEAAAAAERHGFQDRSHLWSYVNVTLALGLGFVEDPRYPWAQTVLGRSDLPPAAKSELLVQRTQAALSLET